MKPSQHTLSSPSTTANGRGGPLQTHRDNRRFVLALFILFAWAITPIFGCAAPYGRLQRDADVTRMFRTNSVPETFHYYIDGRPDLPYAIIGIDPEFKLVPHFWEPVAPNSDRFSKLVDFVWQPDCRTWYNSGQGAYILDSQGNRVGIWYSMYPHTTVVVHEDGRVEVYSPALGDTDDCTTVNLR